MLTMAAFSVYCCESPLVNTAMNKAILGVVIASIVVADVTQGHAQVTFDPKASQTTYFALDQGCVGRLPRNFAYFCTRMDYNS